MQLATFSRLESLDWESRNFGFPVARLNARDLSGGCLRTELDTARCANVELVVATTGSDASISQELLDEFAGTLTDRKATFARPLSSAGEAGGSIASHSESVVSYDQGGVSPELLQLAVSSGVYSRFAVDPRFPRAKFQQMYRIWIECSVRCELADVVLVAPSSGTLDGFITAALSGTTGRIGLIAVAERHARPRTGKKTCRPGASSAASARRGDTQVVTQLANSPACSLYRSCGYSLASVEHYYHFWPQTERN